MRKIRGRLVKLLLLVLLITGLLPASGIFNTVEVKATNTGGQGAARGALCSGAAGIGGTGAAKVLGWGLKFALVDDSCFVDWTSHQIRPRNTTINAYTFLPSVYVLFDTHNNFIGNVEHKNFYVPGCDTVIPASSNKTAVGKTGVHSNFNLGQIPVTSTTKGQFNKIFSSAGSPFSIEKLATAVKKKGGVFRGLTEGMNMPVLAEFFNKYFATKKDGSQTKNFLFEVGDSEAYTYEHFKSSPANEESATGKWHKKSKRFQFAYKFLNFLADNNKVGALGTKGLTKMYKAYFEPFYHARDSFEDMKTFAEDWAWATVDYEEDYSDSFLWGSLLVQPVMLLGQSRDKCCAVTWDQYLLANYYYNNWYDHATAVQSFNGKVPNSTNETNNATESLGLFERYTGGHNVLIDRDEDGASTWRGAANECSQRKSYGLGGVVNNKDNKEGEQEPQQRCIGDKNKTDRQKGQIIHDRKKPVSWGKLDKYKTVFNTTGALDSLSKGRDKSTRDFYMLGYATFGGYTYQKPGDIPPEQEELAHVNLAVTAQYNQLGNYNLSYNTNLVSAKRTSNASATSPPTPEEYNEYSDLKGEIKPRGKGTDTNSTITMGDARLVNSGGKANGAGMFTSDNTKYEHIYGIRYKIPESVCQKVTNKRIWGNYTTKDTVKTAQLVKNELTSSGEGKVVAGGSYTLGFDLSADHSFKGNISTLAGTLFSVNNSLLVGEGTQLNGENDLKTPNEMISTIAKDLISPGLNDSCNMQRVNYKSGIIKSAVQGADAEDDEDDEKSTNVNDSNFGYSAEIFVEGKTYETGVTSATIVYDEDGNLVGVDYSKDKDELTIDPDASYTDDTTHITYKPDKGDKGAVGINSIFEKYCNVGSIRNGTYSGLLYDKDKLNKAGQMKRCYIISVPRGSESRQIKSGDGNADLWKSLFIEAYNNSYRDGDNPDWKILAPGTDADNPINKWVKSITSGNTKFDFETSLQPPVIHSGVCLEDLGLGKAKNDQGYDWYVLNIVIPKIINVSSEVNLLDYQLNYLYPTTFMEDKNGDKDKEHYQRNVAFSREVITGSTEGTYNDLGRSKGHSFYTHNVDNVHEPKSKKPDGTDKVVKESGRTIANNLLLPVRADINSGGTVSIDNRIGHEFTTRERTKVDALGKNGTNGAPFSDMNYSGAYAFNLARGVYGDKRTLSQISKDEIIPASNGASDTYETSPFIKDQIESLGLSLGITPALTNYRVITNKEGTGYINLDGEAWKFHELSSSGSDTVYAGGTGKYVDKYKMYWKGADEWSKSSLDVLLYGSSYQTELLGVNGGAKDDKSYWANNKDNWYKNSENCDRHEEPEDPNNSNHFCYEWAGHWVASRGRDIDGSSIHFYDGRPLKLLVHQIPVYVVKDTIKNTIYKYYTHDTPTGSDEVKYMDRYRTYYLEDTKTGYNNGNCVVGSNKNIVDISTAKLNSYDKPYSNNDGSKTSAKKKAVNNSEGLKVLHSGDLDKVVPSSGVGKESVLNKVSYSKAVAVENGTVDDSGIFTPAKVEYYPEVAMKLYVHAGYGSDGTSYFRNALFHELNVNPINGGYMSYSIKTIGEAKRSTNLSSLYITRVHSSDNDGGRKNATGVIYSDTMGAGTNAGNASTDNKAVIYGGSDITINADTNFELRLYAYSLDLIGSDASTYGDISATYADNRKYTDIINGDNINVYQSWGNPSDDSNTSVVLRNNFRSWADSVRKSMYADMTLKVSGGTAEKTFNNFNVSIGQIGEVDDEAIHKNEKRYSIKVKNGNIVKDETYETLLKDIAADYGYNEDKQDTGDGVSWSASDYRKNAEALFTKSDLWQTIYRSCETSRSNFNKSQTLQTDKTLDEGICSMNQEALDNVRLEKAVPGALATYEDNSGLDDYRTGSWYDEEVKTFVIRRFATDNIAPKHIILTDKLDYGLTPESNAGQSNDSNAQQDSYSTYDGKWYLTLYFRDNLSTNKDINIYNESTALYRPEIGLPNAGYNKDAVDGGNVLVNELHLNGADFLIPSATTNEMNW